MCTLKVKVQIKNVYFNFMTNKTPHSGTSHHLRPFPGRKQSHSDSIVKSRRAEPSAALMFTSYNNEEFYERATTNALL